MNPGELNRRITIQKIVSDKDEDGFEIEGWGDWKTIWACKKELTLKETLTNIINQSETYVTYKIRYLADITTSMRIVENGVTFDIKSILDKDGKKNELYIIAARNDV